MKEWAGQHTSNGSIQSKIKKTKNGMGNKQEMLNAKPGCKAYCGNVTSIVK